MHLHIGLYVRDLDRSIDFYRRFLGVEPAKRRPDYAKFELADPPLVLGMNPAPAGDESRVSHLGLRVASADELERVRARLEAAGLAPVAELGTTCCYARQDKLWVRDPDGNPWEVYVLLEDSERRDDVATEPCCAVPALPAGASSEGRGERACC